MFTVTREFHFCYGHRLLDDNGKCAHPHGHNAKVQITLAAKTLDGQGMVLDFSELKRIVGGWLDTHLDHRMVLAENDPLVPVLAGMNEPMYLMTSPPTAENLAKLIFEQVREQGYPVEKVVFWETEQCFASYS
ncbi:MAG: 6-carboxytetrahydropterin synthase [Planctomycetaceae bacterium]|nr:6-carboxytetrahydropterin synthase [Planctomycetaceae bacterium]